VRGGGRYCLDNNKKAINIVNKSVAMKNNDRDDDCHAHDKRDPEGRYQEASPFSTGNNSGERRQSEGRYQKARRQDEWPRNPFVQKLYPDWKGTYRSDGSPSLFIKGAKWIKVDGTGRIINRGININIRDEV